MVSAIDGPFTEQHHSIKMEQSTSRGLLKGHWKTQKKKASYGPEKYDTLWHKPEPRKGGTPTMSSEPN